MKKKIKILLEWAWTATTISILKWLKFQKKYEYETIVLDIFEINAWKYFADNYYRSILSIDDKYIDFILEIFKKEKFDIYIPIIDHWFLKLSENKYLFEELWVYVMIWDKSIIEILSDKYKTYNFFIENNIPTPRSYIKDNIKTDILRYPLIIKPKVWWIASQWVYIIENNEDYKFYSKKSDNIIIQERIEWREFTADCLSSLDWKYFIEAVIRERIETKWWLSVKASIVESELSVKIKAYIKRIAELLKLPWVYNIQWFIKDNSDIYFIEINPRFAWTHAFTIWAWMNSIKHILDMYSWISIEDIKKQIRINESLKMVRYWEEIFIEWDKTWTWHD